MEQELTITGKTQTAEDAALQEALCRSGPIPHHIAIIMDGNGRWAQERGMRRVLGHREGIGSVREVVSCEAVCGDTASDPEQAVKTRVSKTRSPHRGTRALALRFGFIGRRAGVSWDV